MGRFHIQGGTPLSGKVRIEGAKNAILPVLSATLLHRGINQIHGISPLRDVELMFEILRSYGAEIELKKRRAVIDTSNVNTDTVPEDLMRKMRATIFLMGPLLASHGQARLAYPGGCAIGPRPIDWHLKALSQLGAEITKKSGLIEAKADVLTGCDILLDFPSVGVTENVMMAASLARGQTRICNVAREPEIICLQNFLNGMGARISGAGTGEIRIRGVDQLHGTEHCVIPDRIAAGTYMIAAAITGGEITIDNVIPEHLESLISKLRECGVEVDVCEDTIQVRGRERIRAVDFNTQPYPGFPTDLQPQMMSLLTTARGTSIIRETIFENRMKHAEELHRMGARIHIEGRTAVVRGVEQLSGAVVRATDLRAGAALVLAALRANGESKIEEIEHIERGYSAIDTKLSQLGAKIRCDD